jgi:hypothetical protein
MFPLAAVICSAGFAYLAFAALKPGQATMQILRIVSNGGKVNGYPAAAALSLSIGPFTRLAMIPTNFELIEMNEKRVRKRNERSAGGGGRKKCGGSIIRTREANEFADLSGPHGQTERETSRGGGEKVKNLLGRLGSSMVLEEF